MLAVVGASGARLFANSVAYCLARVWSGSGSGRPVALIDADTTGSALYERLGECGLGVYAPERRGLPSLMASRSSLAVPSLAEHSYEMGRGPGSLWMLFGPRHIDGGGLAAGWLAKRFEDLVRIDSERAVVVAASLLRLDVRLSGLLARVTAAVVIVPLASAEALDGLRRELHDAGLAGRAGCSIGLVVEGDSSLSDGEIAETLGIAVAGRLRVRPDAAVLRAAGRRGRFAKDVEALASELDPAGPAARVCASDSAAGLGVPVSGDETADADAARPAVPAAGGPAAVGAARPGIGVAGFGCLGQWLGLPRPAGGR